MKTGKILLCGLTASQLLGMSSRSGDNGKEQGKTMMTLPSQEFGKSVSEVQESETSRGFAVSKTDSCHLKVVKTENAAELS